MKRMYLPLILFVLFILEGTVMQVFAPENYGSPFILVPRFVMIVIVLVALFQSIPLAVVYAIFSGLLYDVIYTDIVGIYMFAMAVTVYIVGHSARILHINAVVGVFISFITVIVLDLFIYGLYTLVGYVHLPIKLFFLERLLPSILLNGVFFILIFAPLKFVFEKIKE